MNEHTNPRIASLLTLLSDIAGKKSEVLVCEVMQKGELRITIALNPGPEHAQGQIFKAWELRNPETEGCVLHNHTVASDGRTIKSSAVALQENGKTVGWIIVNTDITDMVFMQKYLAGITGIGQTEGFSSYTDINLLLDNMLEQALSEIGKPVAYMKKADKRAFIKYLDDKGYFQIKKSSDKVMKYLDISKFTLYSHLEEIRSTEA